MCTKEECEWHLPIVHPGFWLWFAWVAAAIPISGDWQWHPGLGQQECNQEMGQSCPFCPALVNRPHLDTATNPEPSAQDQHQQPGVRTPTSSRGWAGRAHPDDEKRPWGTSADRFTCGWAMRLSKHRLEAEVPEREGHQAEGQVTSKSRVPSPLYNWTILWNHDLSAKYYFPGNAFWSALVLLQVFYRESSHKSKGILWGLRGLQEISGLFCYWILIISWLNCL